MFKIIVKELFMIVNFYFHSFSDKFSSGGLNTCSFSNNLKKRSVKCDPMNLFKNLTAVGNVHVLNNDSLLVCLQNSLFKIKI